MMLREKVLYLYVFACRKHDLAPDAEQYAEDEIDRMSNSEFLSALSDALDEILQIPRGD